MEPVMPHLPSRPRSKGQAPLPVVWLRPHVALEQRHLHADGAYVWGFPLRRAFGARAPALTVPLQFPLPL